MVICPRCSSLRVHKDGKRKNSTKHDVQVYECQGCNRKFTIPIVDFIAEKEETIHAGQIVTYETDEVVRVHGLTDMHVGANEFDLKKFQEAVQIIYDDPNAMWFGNGDMIECIPPHYKISQRGQYIRPDEQHLAFLDIIKPIIDKCLFIRGGNHDYLRSIRMLDYDVSMIIARELCVPYFKLPGYSVITVKGSSWNLVTGHGHSGAKNGDLELDKLAAVYSKGDVFFLGHNHQLYAKPIDSIKIVDNEESLHRRWYIRGGSFLRYAEYARYAIFPVVRTGWVTIEFDKDDINCWTN